MRSVLEGHEPRLSRVVELAEALGLEFYVGPPREPVALEQIPRKFFITSGRRDDPQRVLLYGTGGIGKTTLASLAPGAVVLDVEGGAWHLEVECIHQEQLGSFGALRACLHSDVLEGAGTVIIDSATRVERLAVAHTLATVKHEKGRSVSRIEEYGFGKGYQHVYETYLLLLADLDRQIDAGRNVILVAHECINDVPNPKGDDWIRYEPHLQQSKSSKASIRDEVFHWADHVLFLRHDVAQGGPKGIWTGTRSIYPAEMPTHVAKSRTLPPEPIPYTSAQDGAVWDRIFSGTK